TDELRARERQFLLWDSARRSGLLRKVSRSEIGVQLIKHAQACRSTPRQIRDGNVSKQGVMQPHWPGRTRLKHKIARQTALDHEAGLNNVSLLEILCCNSASIVWASLVKLSVSSPSL